MECDDDEANDGAALFKTIEAFRGAFFFSTSVELKTKGAGGGEAGREMMDSNTSYLFFRQVLGTQLWQKRKTIASTDNSPQCE